MPERRVIATFDCYGTLIDWLSGAKEAFKEAYPEYSGLADDFIKYWGEKDWELVTSGIYRPYREILSTSFRYALDKLNLRYDNDVIEKLTYSIYRWRAFPDVKPALKKLIDEGVELGIISNTDKNFIVKSIENIDVEFKYVIVAEDIKIYKPDPRVFKKAGEILPKARWIHISAYPQYDIIPASKIGIETILLDRYGLKYMVRDIDTIVIDDIDKLPNLIINK